MFNFSDMTIKVKDIKQGKEVFFEGHKAPILSVTLDPKSEFLVSISDRFSVLSESFIM